MNLTERQINTIARWLQLHDFEGDRAAANRAWGPELCDYGDAYQSSYRRKARKLAHELTEEGEPEQETGETEEP